MAALLGNSVLTESDLSAFHKKLLPKQGEEKVYTVYLRIVTQVAIKMYVFVQVASYLVVTPSERLCIQQH